MEQKDSVLGFKLLAVLGVVGIIALIVSSVLLGMFVLKEIYSGSSGFEQPSVSTVPSTKTPELGEEGHACGGAARLPCKPGLVCSNDATIIGSEGECVAVAPSP